MAGEEKRSDPNACHYVDKVDAEDSLFDARGWCLVSRMRFDIVAKAVA